MSEVLRDMKFVCPWSNLQRRTSGFTGFAHVIKQIHISVNFFDWCCLKYVLNKLWITNIKKEPVNRFPHEHLYSLNVKSSQFILLVQNVRKSLKELIWFQLRFVLYFKSMIVNAVKSIATSFTLANFRNFKYICILKL